jgi:hypothetical protein
MEINGIIYWKGSGNIMGISVSVHVNDDMEIRPNLVVNNGRENGWIKIGDATIFLKDERQVRHLISRLEELERLFKTLPTREE